MLRVFVRTYVGLAALALGMAATAPARALECDEFIAALTSSGQLRPNQVRPAQDMPAGNYEFEGVPQIKGGMRCTNGNLETVGATALSGEPRVMQAWTLLMSLSLGTLAPTQYDARRVAAAISDAKMDAERNRKSLGIATGSGHSQFASWYLSVVIIPNVGLQFEIAAD
ncbi:hypothetical protein [Aurantimonas phage AmM-1]|uniref:hypothetical protein n=1 Tax=Aurantimonas phage AmM-1 TaxID=1503929 RepID=UPI000540BCC9|nr:hypothetical protein ACQ23_gp57 [Aurantimonas phage AmM-1]BAP94514.1 hypothetical protein [Aurantimonas phage AmM-1]